MEIILLPITKVNYPQGHLCWWLYFPHVHLPLCVPHTAQLIINHQAHQQIQGYTCQGLSLTVVFL